MPYVSVESGIPELKNQDPKNQKSTSEQSVEETFEDDKLSYYQYANTISMTLIC